METLQFIPDIQTSPSQLECLTYVAGYALFSYMKKTNKCTNCYNFLTTDKQMELLNDVGSQYILVDLLDRGSLMFPSLTVIDCVNIIYSTFMKIDTSEIICKNFYDGPCRSLLVRISMSIIEEKHIGKWRELCDCKVWRWDILHKLVMTVSNCILSRRIKNFNALVAKSDNTKLKKFSI